MTGPSVATASTKMSRGLGGPQIHQDGHPDVHLPEPAENLAFWKVAVATHPLATVGQLLLVERRQVFLELRRVAFDLHDLARGGDA